MATYKLQTPSSPTFNAERVITGQNLANNIITIQQGFNPILKFVELNCKVPSEIIVSLMLATSYQNAPAKPELNYGITGWSLLYGTVAPATQKRRNANVVLNWERLRGRMTSVEEAKLKEFGIVYDAKTRTFTEITKNKQGEYYFNVLYAGILLGQLMDNNVDGVTAKNWNVYNNLNLALDRIIVLFLNGADTSKESVKMALSRNYDNAKGLIEAIRGNDPYSAQIVNMICGKGGYLDSLVNGWSMGGYKEYYRKNW